MKKILLGAAALAALAGCGNNEMTQSEIDKAKTAKFDDAAKAKMAEGMAAGGKARQAQQQQWATNNPEKLAQINAERAKMGRPPLGGH